MKIRMAFLFLMGFFYFISVSFAAELSVSKEKVEPIYSLLKKGYKDYCNSKEENPLCEQYRELIDHFDLLHKNGEVKISRLSLTDPLQGALTYLITVLASHAKDVKIDTVIKLADSLALGVELSLRQDEVEKIYMAIKEGHEKYCLSEAQLPICDQIKDFMATVDVLRKKGEIQSSALTRPLLESLFIYLAQARVSYAKSTGVDPVIKISD